MKAYVYILRDQNGMFYIGSTSNLIRRLKQHIRKHTQTTARMKDPMLVLSQEYLTLDIARKIEKKIKNLKRKDYIEKMINDGRIKMKP